MTEKLKTLLHDQAETIDFAGPDLDAITATGDRRVRRRRAAGLVGGLAALAVVGGVAVVSLSGDDGGPQVAGEPLPTASLSWATGSTLHAGGERADLGHRVAAYVGTDAGYVFTDGEGAVFSYSGGSVDRVGTTSAGMRPRLVADSTGTLAGWVDPSGDRPAFVVLDQATGDVQRYDDATAPGMGELADEKNPAYLYAIDQSTTYWRDSRGAVAVDLASGAATVLDPKARNGFDLIDVEAGVLAVYGDEGVEVGPSRAQARPLPGVLDGSGVLSPDARFYAPDADELRVVDVATGADLALQLPASYFFSTGYQWLDTDTLAVIALVDEDAPVSLLTCTVSAGTCTVVTDDAGEQGQAQIAVGEPIG
ncbi:hypothetical protein [Nocardioides sp. W7]|uniref:hypothetical protein n=1 Tax=Nocardioides sp. W7 TaxID=2931390 RepID=UPI001FD563C7|nr:hypothetical protein [Nocardioides sp. W7]